MKMLVCGHYDKKLNVYTSPFTLPICSDEDLIEQTRRMCVNPQVPSAYFEYDLYKFGIYDDKLGEFELESKPVFICSLADFKHLREVLEDGQA